MSQQDDAELIAYATTSLPEVIALPVARWSVEDANDNSDPLRCLEFLWKALERIDAYVAVLSVLEYVRDGNRAANGLPVQSADAERVVEILRGDGPLHWGDWKTIRRPCVQAFDAAPDRLFYRDLVALNNDFLLRERGNHALVMRNASAHGIGGTWSTDADAEGACRRELLDVLGHLRTRSLDDLRLVRVLAARQQDGEGSGRPWDLVIEDLTGSQATRPRYRVGPLTFHGRLASPGELCILGASAAGLRGLSLFPMYTWLPASDDGEVSQFEGKRHRRSYLGLRTGASHDSDPGHRFDDALGRQPDEVKDAIEKLKDRMSPAWSRAIQNAHALSGDLLRQVRQDRVYLPAAFVQRKQAGERIGQFLDAAVRAVVDQPDAGENPSVPRLLLVTGMAGAGKTSFLCRLAEVLLERWPIVPVVTVTAARLESLDNIGRGAADLTCLQWLGLEKTELRKLLQEAVQEARRARKRLATGQEDESVRAAGRPVRPTGAPPDVNQPANGAPAPPAADLTAGIPPAADPDGTLGVASSLENPFTAGLIILLIDGIDRTADSRQVLDHIHRVVTHLPGFVCIATIARPVLQGLAEHCDGWKALARFGTSGADDLAVGIGPLDDDDARRAWESYTKQPGSSPLTRWDDVNPSLKAAAQNPLLLRLACESYDGRVIPPWVNEVDVLRQHAHRYIWQDYRRAHVVRELVKAMWRGDGARPSRRLKLTSILNDPALREAALDPTGPLAGLEGDHILVRVPISGRGAYEAPDYAVEFAFDALLGYLFFALDGSGVGGGLGIDEEDSSEANPVARIKEFAAHAATAAPLGYSMDLVLRSEFSKDPKEAAVCLECIKCLLTPGVGGRVPETRTSCVARFLYWVNAQHSPESNAYVKAMTPSGTDATETPDLIFNRAADLLRDIREVIRDAAREQTPEEIPGEIPKEIPEEIPGVIPEEAPELIAEEIPEEVPEKTPEQRAAAGESTNPLGPIHVVDRIFQLKPPPPAQAVRDVAEHLADRQLSMLAGYVAHKLLSRDEHGRFPRTHDALAALRLRAEALLREGSVVALRQAIKDLPEAADWAREIRNKEEYLKLQRLIARIHRAQEDLKTAEESINDLLDHSGDARKWWEPDAHAENVLLRAEILRESNVAVARWFLNPPGEGDPPEGTHPPGHKWEDWCRDVPKDVDEACRHNPRLNARWMELKARLADDEAATLADLVKALQAYQSIGAMAEAAQVLAYLTELEYDQQTGVSYQRAIDFGERARLLADSAGVTKAWFLATEWQVRALARTTRDPSAMKPYRLAIDALDRALPLRHRRFLVQGLIAVISASTENGRHSIARRAAEMVSDIYAQWRGEGSVTAKEAAYKLEDLLDATTDLGECQASLEIGEKVWELGKTDEGEKPWAGAMYARALANAALVDPEKWGRHGRTALDLLEELRPSPKLLKTDRFLWQFARAEALALLAARDPRTAAARLEVHLTLEASKEDANIPGTEAALAHGVIGAWLALALSLTIPASEPDSALDRPRDLAEQAYQRLGAGRGRQHRPVAAYARALALKAKFERNGQYALKRESDKWLEKAREAVEKDFPEFYDPDRPTDAEGRETLEMGHIMVKAIHGRHTFASDPVPIQPPAVDAELAQGAGVESPAAP